MFKILTISVLLFSVSCKKAIEDKKEQLIMDAITNGIWVVEKYTEDGNDKTAEFLTYEFKFNEDESLYANTEGTRFSGTWKPNVAEITITTDFPGAVDPLKKLIGVWKLTDSGMDFVKAQTTDSGVFKTLQLRKK